ncbi:beta/gamma crystallin [Hydrogenispora ethanolica]|jgi:hypothetical protein|uniref:Beta/gamma crystallin n=1 Tax=Hydrogenispora ethanolica TaxID=1082276 RepID=A0A4R1S750_HYDET|nr:beta/gamma crystallin-related protein [Hydrogenispora ethanolica]TCL75131.1 beta/gamma crystallin [Hydrogenispora ethanolica]
MAGHLILFQHADLRGAHRHVFEKEADLCYANDTFYHGSIASFVILSGVWKFYRDAKYKRPYSREFGPGIYRWVEDCGFDNDQVYSLQCMG